MNYHFAVPAIVATKETVSQRVLKLWKTAVFTIKQAQKKFVEAYRATLDEMAPGWKERWQTDPHFVKRLAEVEDYVKALCRENGMALTVFNRYRSAARKHLLMEVPFNLAATNFTIQELREIKDGGEERAKEMRQEKNVKHAATVVAKHATILPLPDGFDNEEDYLDVVKARLLEHLDLAKEKLGADAFQRLIQELRVLHDGYGSSAEQAA